MQFAYSRRTATKKQRSRLLLNVEWMCYGESTVSHHIICPSFSLLLSLSFSLSCTDPLRFWPYAKMCKVKPFLKISIELFSAFEWTLSEYGMPMIRRDHIITLGRRDGYHIHKLALATVAKSVISSGITYQTNMLISYHFNWLDIIIDAVFCCFDLYFDYFYILLQMVR